MKVISQKTRLLSIVFICIAITSICLSVIAIMSIKKISKNIFNEQGFAVIEKALNYIDGDEFYNFSRNYKDLNDFYFKTYDSLFTLRKNTECTYLYTIVSDYFSNDFLYMIDASDELTSDKLETPGNIFDSTEDYEVIQKAISSKKMVATEMYNTEEWGWIITFYGPILNSQDNVVGLVACDFLVYDFLSQVKGVQNVMIFIGLGFLVIFVFISFLYLSAFFKKLLSVTNAMEGIATGATDLTVRLEVSSEDELGKLSIACNSVIEKLQVMISQVKKSVNILSDKSEHLHSTSENTVSQIDEIKINVDGIDIQADNQNTLAIQTHESIDSLKSEISSLTENINNQTSAIRQSSTAIEEITANIESISKNVNTMTQDYEVIVNETQEGIRLQKLVREKVEDIGEEANNLEEANVIITDIAEKTNLLSMNASIEAAHAGKAGAGFSVVAGEIRVLAETSNKQSDAIRELLQKVNKAIKEIDVASKASEESFVKLGERIIVMEKNLQQIQDGINEQSVGTHHILEMVDIINNSAFSIKQDSEQMNENSEIVCNNIRFLGKSSDKILRNTHFVVTSLDEIKESATMASDSATQNLSLTEELNNLVSGYKTE